MWLATWEAIQNAVKHGSQPGEVIDIHFLPPDEAGRLRVSLVQPRAWEAWEQALGAPRKAEVEAGKFRLGGTIIMHWLADQIRVTDQGRNITLLFSRTVKPDRQVHVPPKAESLAGP